MNRSLRSNVLKHLFRAFVSLTLLLTLSSVYGQITNCPSGFVSLLLEDDVNCTSSFATNPDISASGTATFTSTGATDVPMPTAFSMLDGFPFVYGVSEVTIVDGMDNCIFTVVITDVAPSFATVCDDITVDLAGECSQEFTLPGAYTLDGSDDCPTGSITFSFSDMDPNANSILLEADNLGDMPVTVFISNGSQQGSCARTITVEDSAPIVAAISCPSDITVEVAPTCQYLYNFSVDAEIPCNGSVTQTAGPPTGSALGVGSTTFGFQVEDSGGAPQASCTWSVTVVETPEAGAQVNCIAELNVSIDQTCEVQIGPANLVTGQICSDISLFTVAATLPDGEEVSGSTITITQEWLGREIDVNVFDPNGVNSCWGTVTLEDKVAPLIACPADITITCLETPDTSLTGLPMLLNSINDPFANLAIDGATLSNGSCVVDLFWNDIIEEFTCNGPFQRVVSRTFYVKDNAGNRSESCTQTISVTRETLASAIYPEHYDGQDTHSGISDNGVGSNPPLACDGQDIEWNSFTNEDGRVVPSPFDSITPGGMVIPGTGAPGGVGTCGTINYFFEDLVIDICGDNCSNFNPSYKLLRTFDVYDWCTGEIILHEQIIKVVDTVPPVFTTVVPDLTVSTDIWGCGATIDLPYVEASDNCSSDIFYSWYITGGTYDAVLNRVYVHDNAITMEGEEIELIAYAEDCCGNVVADTGYVTIIDAVAPVIAADEHTTVSLNSLENEGATKVFVESFDDGSWDNCGPIDMWVRRMDNACEDYDGLDSNGNEDPDEIDEINDFHKYIHFCCEDVGEEQMVVFMVCDDGDQDGIVEMNGDDNCTTAMIMVDVQDKLAPTVVCPPPVTINCIDFALYEDFMDGALDTMQERILNVRFGTAFTTSTCVLVTSQTFSGSELCGGGTATRTFTATNSNGDASCDQVITIVAEEENILTCDRISFPTLSAAPYNYDWCDPADEESPFVSPVVVTTCGGVMIEEPVIDRDDLCTEVGINVTLDTFEFAGGGCLKILAHWEVIDECIFKENFLTGSEEEGNLEVDPFVAENGYYEIYVEYDIFDEDPPVIDCEDVIVETADCIYNYDIFSVTATDECTPSENIGYAFRVDLNADGTYDFPTEDESAEGGSFDASVIGGLPIGRHIIKWVASDGCDNYSVCTQEVIVVQRLKEPTPYCHLGLSSAVMDEQFGCSVEFWADDFVADQTLGPCGENVDYLMIPYQDIFGDPADDSDDLSVEEALEQAAASWEFGCSYIENGVQGMIEIRIYAIDENGLYDFCDASLTLNDNFDCCQDTELGTTIITGNIMTETGYVMGNIELTVDGEAEELPKTAYTNEDGIYMFNNLDYDQDYKVSAFNDEKALEGVTTLDLVLIQRHLLGMSLLDSPYKIIAADINANEKVTVADLLQLRKLILGLYADDKFPSNLSWRFLDDGFNFVDPTRPFPYNETINISGLPHAMYNQNFVAVKTGDVNGSVEGLKNGTSSKRELRNYPLSIDNEIFDKGEYLNIPVRAGRSSEIVGLQFALQYDESIISSVDLVGERLNISEDQVVIKGGEVRVSWNELVATTVEEGEVLFTLKVSSAKSSRITNAFRLDASRIQAELYNEKLETENLTLNYRTVDGADFELLQNEPNPFTNTTRITFMLPESGDVSLTIYDLSGKMILNKRGNYAAGENAIILNAEEMNGSGVLYYQMDFGGQQITKKMILID